MVIAKNRILNTPYQKIYCGSISRFLTSIIWIISRTNKTLRMVYPENIILMITILQKYPDSRNIGSKKRLMMASVVICTNWSKEYISEVYGFRKRKKRKKWRKTRNSSADQKLFVHPQGISIQNFFISQWFGNFSWGDIFWITAILWNESSF